MGLKKDSLKIQGSGFGQGPGFGQLWARDPSRQGAPALQSRSVADQAVGRPPSDVPLKDDRTSIVSRVVLTRILGECPQATLQNALPLRF
jgi:hypothetical protein